MGGIAFLTGKAVVNHGLDKIRNANADNPNAPLDGNIDGHLSGKPENGLVSSLVHFVHKGSVIEADWGPNNNNESELSKLLKKQQKPAEPLNAGVAEEGGEGGEQPAEQEAKVVVKPINLDDFKAVIGTKKGFLGNVNKGYVRFAKTPEGGLKLEKVGNKCGWFINSRINVTPEHNREMRRLFADTLLADWGGADRFDVDKNLYGPTIISKLGGLREKILKGLSNDNAEAQPGKLLSREEIAAAIAEYESIFSPDNLTNVAETFLGTCFKGLDFVMPGKTNPDLKDFMAQYGKYADEGFRTQDNLENLIKACKSGAELRATMVKIADQFDKMNLPWQTDRAVMTLIDQMEQSLTTGAKTYTEDQLGRFGGLLLKRLQAEGKFANLKDNGKEVTNFLHKILPIYAQSVRFEYANKVSKLKSEQANNPDLPNLLKQAEDEFKTKLKMDSVVKQAEDFFAAMDAHKGEQAGSDPVAQIKTLIQSRKNELVAEFNTKCQTNPDLSQEEYNAGNAEVEKQLANLNQQLQYLDSSQDIINDHIDNVLKQNSDKYLLVEADELKNSKFEWSKEELGAILTEGFKDIPTEFADEFFMVQYTSEKFASVYNKLQFNEIVKENKLDPANALMTPKLGFENCQSILKSVMDSITAKIDQAVAINLVGKDDISMQEFITHMADYIQESSIRGDMHGTSFDLNLDGTRKGSVTITYERLMKLFVDKAIEHKVSGDKRYADMAIDLKEKFKMLLGKLPEYISKFDPEKTPELKRFYCDVRGFSRVDVFKEDKLYSEKAMLAGDLTRAVQIKMLEQFLQVDLYSVIDAELEENAFADEVDTHLKMLFTETIAKTTEEAVHNVYEGTLNFRTGDVTDSSRAQASLDGDVKDPTTKFTNPDRVKNAYLRHVKGFDFEERILDQRDKLVYHPIQLDQLKGKLVKRAKALWEGEVVGHAPGRGISDTVDWVVYKVKKTFNMNRFVDITDKWVQSREKGFEKKLNSMTNKYFAFEEKFVKLCRDRAANALMAKNDPRFAAMRDMRMRDLLLNDVLAGFQEPMQKVLERYIQTPEAFAKLMKNEASFARFVDDALGILPRDSKGVQGTAGYKTLAEALDTTAGARLNLINDWTMNANVSVLASKVAEQFKALARDPKFLDTLPKNQRAFLENMIKDENFWSFGGALLTEGATRLGEVVLSRPLDFFRPTPEEFHQDLAKILIADMSVRFQGFDDENALGALKKELGNTEERFGGSNEVKQAKGLAGDYDKAFANEPALLAVLSSEEKQAMLNFAANYGAIDPGLSKDKRRDAIRQATSNTVEHFKNVLDLAKVAMQNKQAESFLLLREVYNKTLKQCEDTLSGKGVFQLAVDQFRLAADAIFKKAYTDVEKRIANGLSDNSSKPDLTKHLGDVSADLMNQVRALMTQCENLLTKEHMLFTEESTAALFADMGIAKGNPGYTSSTAFKEAITEFMAKSMDCKLMLESKQAGFIVVLGVSDNPDIHFVNDVVKREFTESFAEIYHEKAVAAARNEALARVQEKVEAAVAAIPPGSLTVEEADTLSANLAKTVQDKMVNLLDAQEKDNLEKGTKPGEVDHHRIATDYSLYNCENFKDIPLDEIDKLISEGVSAAKVEHTRVAWLEDNLANIEKNILEVNVDLFSAKVVGEGKNAAPLIEQARQELTAKLEGFLRTALLTGGTAEEWTAKIASSENSSIVDRIGGDLKTFITDWNAKIAEATKKDEEELKNAQLAQARVTWLKDNLANIEQKIIAENPSIYSNSLGDKAKDSVQIIEVARKDLSAKLEDFLRKTVLTTGDATNWSDKMFGQVRKMFATKEDSLMVNRIGGELKTFVEGWGEKVEAAVNLDKIAIAQGQLALEQRNALVNTKAAVMKTESTFKAHLGAAFMQKVIPDMNKLQTKIDLNSWKLNLASPDSLLDVYNQVVANAKAKKKPKQVVDTAMLKLQIHQYIDNYADKLYADLLSRINSNPENGIPVEVQDGNAVKQTAQKIFADSAKDSIIIMGQDTNGSVNQRVFVADMLKSLKAVSDYLIGY